MEKFDKFFNTTMTFRLNEEMKRDFNIGSSFREMAQLLRCFIACVCFIRLTEEGRRDVKLWMLGRKELLLKAPTFRDGQPVWRPE